MTEIPYEWAAYARLQSKLAASRSIVIARALEEALNVVHQTEFRPEAVAEADLHRLAANAARQERHRGALRRQVQALALDEATAARQIDDGDTSTGASSLDDAYHARRELQRLSGCLAEDDWSLLLDVAAGIPYGELAAQRSSTPVALRSRVCRLRQVIGESRNKLH
ncbi:hypothetical protein [Ralstonia pseudosolanacearum]|uniref:hypothetical protein n=1 Tax=Ralstonia pseudosolanacearum TaxID=1310165 RepID=UPI00405423F2